MRSVSLTCIALALSVLPAKQRGLVSGRTRFSSALALALSVLPAKAQGELCFVASLALTGNALALSRAVVLAFEWPSLRAKPVCMLGAA